MVSTLRVYSLGGYSLKPPIWDLDMYTLAVYTPMVYTMGVYTLGVDSLGPPSLDLSPYLPVLDDDDDKDDDYDGDLIMHVNCSLIFVTPILSTRSASLILLKHVL